MGRPKDKFWKHVHPESNNGRFKCNFCDKGFAGGISRIKSHLSGIKGRDIDICLKVPDDIRAEARQAIDDSLPCEKKGKKTIESPPCKKKGKRIISFSDDIRAEARQAIDDSLPCKKKGKKTIESPPCKKKGKKIISISDDDDDETVFVGATAEQHAIGSSPSNNLGGKGVVVEAPNDDEIVVDEDEPNSARLLLTASCTSRESRKKELDKQVKKCYEIMGRPRDKFWKHVHPESNGRFKCYFCDKDFAGGISRIKSHLSGIKGCDIDICLKVRDDIRDEARQAIDDSLPCKKKGKKTIDSPPCKKKGKRIISISDDIRAEALQAIDDSLPCKKTIEMVKGGPNLAILDEQILEYEQVVKESWRETGFTLMIAPEYNGESEEEYVNVFAYCPKGMLLLTSGNFSAAELCTRLCLQAIALDDCTELASMIEDNNYPGVLLRSLSPITTIHGLVEYFVSFVNSFCLLLDAVEIIFIYMWKFNSVWKWKILNEWKEHTRLKFTYPVMDSDRLMLLRPVIEHEAEVVSTVQSMDISKWVADVVTSKKFWTMGKQLIHIIDILFPLAHLVQGREPAFGYFYEAVNKASDALDEFRDKDPMRYTVETLRRMIKPIHAAACLLNPAIMCSENFKEDSQMMEGIDELMENFFVDQADRDLFLSQVELYRAKSPCIFTATAYRKSKTLYPGAWWREFGGRVPELQKCAMRILSQPCDVPLWTLDLPAANKASKPRKLKLSVMEKFSGSEASSLEPIDLETTVESCEYEEQEYFDDLSTSSNPSATLGLKTRFLDPEEIDFSLSKYQDVHDFFLATTEICSTQ